MKLYLLYFFLQQHSSGEILQKTSDNLNTVTAIRYEHERDYFTGDKHFYTKAVNYLDFGIENSFRYWSETPDQSIIYNGTENFVLNKKEKTILVNNKPSLDNVEGASFYYNSLITLRRNLPAIIADKSIVKLIKDTLYEGSQRSLVRFSLHKKLMNNFGGFMNITEDRTIHYTLIIDKESYWPLCLIQTNSADEHSATVTYKNIAADPKIPKEDFWYYSTYSSSYKPAASKKMVLSLAAGLQAPGFEVRSYPDSLSINFDKYKGKILLLEFWIRNCGPCIESVPKLNTLAGKFKEVQILAVNAHDRKETVKYFVDRYKVNYPVAYKGEVAAKIYGVEAFPVVFIINQKGNIVYSGGFDKDIIAENLKALQAQ